MDTGRVQPDADAGAISRRAVLGGALGGLVVVAGGLTAVRRNVLGLHDRLEAALGRPIPGAVPTVPPSAGAHVSGSFSSAAMGGTIGWEMSYPPGATPGTRLPLVLMLHGRGDDHATPFTELGIDSIQRAVVAAGSPPFVVCAPDGDETFWRPRADGQDGAAMITDELLPVLARDHGVDTATLAITGYSMGGYGALTLAARELKGKVRAIAPVSTPVWSSNADTASTGDQGAFDSDADFTRWDPRTMVADWQGLPIRMSCGLQDPFYPGDVELLGLMSGLRPTPQRDLSTGGHDMTFWQQAFPGQLSFLAGFLR